MIRKVVSDSRSTRLLTPPFDRLAGLGGNPSDDTSVQDGINEGSDVGETDESTAEAEDLD